MKILLPFLLLVVLSTCDKPNDQPKSVGCDDFILEHFGYEPSDGNVDFSGPNCVSFLSKYRGVDGNYYYSSNCNCCDFILSYYNCAGENICAQDGTCPAFDGAELIRIVGVGE